MISFVALLELFQLFQCHLFCMGTTQRWQILKAKAISVCDSRHPSHCRISGLAEFLVTAINPQSYGRCRILTFDQPPCISSKYITFDPGQSLCTMMNVDKRLDKQCDLIKDSILLFVLCCNCFTFSFYRYL